jgi:5-formyltetrahydrofolate cyclo-ligase
MTDKMIDKATLRQQALRRRAQIASSPDDADRAAALFMEALNPNPDTVVALYHPRADEIDTLPLAHKLAAAGVPHALPVVQPGSRILRFARWHIGQPLTEGAFRIPEPLGRDWLEPDVVVVPLLAFDGQGHRLGYGGGYYDATLRTLRGEKKIVAVGLAYDQQESQQKVPVEPYDEPLDWVITPGSARLYGKKT